MNKKLLTTLCALALLVGGSIFASVAHAQALPDAQSNGSPATFDSTFGNPFPATANDTLTPGTSPGSPYTASAPAAAATPVAPPLTPQSTGDASVWSLIKGGVEGFIDYIVASLFHLALWVMSWWVVMTGALLNTSIILTLHIKDFVNATQGVYLVWQTIRDISGIFIIFVLLYVSFLLILGQDSKTLGSPGNLIKNIVIAGILINFSFFITSLLIDASNIVSLAIYNGIIGTSATTAALPSQQAGCAPAPASAGTAPAGGLDTCDLISGTLSGTSGGLGDIFMQQLNIQGIQSPSNTNLGNTTSTLPDFLTIILQGIAGCIIMFTAGFSFLLASLAFVARLIILIVLLAFSPIWFAAMIFPALKERAKHFTDHLYSQCVFMPVYLLLMYAALLVLTKSTVFTNPTANAFAGTGVSGWVPVNLIVLGINDFFIIFLLNLPLVVAFSMGGSATEFLKKGVDNFGAKNVWKNFGSQAGSRTVGRVAYSLNESTAMKKLAAASPFAGGLASQGLSKVSSAGFGAKKGSYENRLKEKKKAEEAMHKRIGNVERGNYRTEEEFKAAQAEARGYQERYRANLPWNSSLKTPGGVLGFMVDNRAHRETAAKLNKKAGDEAIKKAEKGNRKAMEDLKKELGSLDEASPLILSGRLADEVERTKKAKRDEITKKMEELQEKIDKAQEIKEDERDDKIMKKLDDLEKKEGGSGDKKEDKK